MGSYRYRWAPSLRLRHQGSFSPRLTNRGVKTIQRHRPQWDWALLICARTASALAKKRSALQKKKGRVLAGPSAASACWTPLPFPGSGPGFVSGHPVAAEKEKGWARFALDCEEIAFHYLLDRSSTGKGPVKLQGALSNGVMRATPPMGWTTPQAEVLPRG